MIVITSDDMDRYHAKAQCEMRAAVAHWNILATMTESELELDRNRDLVIDHRVLRVAGNERRAVVRAFGCAFDFSDLTMQKFSRSYGGWIRIRFDPIARFIS